MNTQQEPTLKQDLRYRYGKETVNLIKSYERCVEKLARYKNPVVFNLRCKSSGVIPSYLRVRPPLKTARAQRIAERAMEAFLQERIREAVTKKKKLDDDRKWIALGLKRRLDRSDFDKVVGMVTRCGESTFVKTKSKQEEKFARFQKKTEVPRRHQTHEKWIKNLSNHQLTKEETSVLGRGLNFAPVPSKVPTKDIIASVEPALHHHDNPSEANVARAAVCNILRNSKPPRDNLTFGEKEALKALRKNEEIVIAKADKGNVAVVMNKEEYETKASEILQVAPFQPVDSDMTTATERKLNQTLKNLLDKKAISKPLYNHLASVAWLLKTCTLLRIAQDP